jgi:amino-acid N-acetyltransferase
LLDIKTFVHGFRNAAPYINTFRGRTFIVCFGGEAVQSSNFAHLIHDIALLNSLGIRLVLAHGARPQIEQRLKERDAEIHYVSGLRVTDDTALECVKEAAGTVRMEIEALLSMGLANSPMAGAGIRVTSGNFVTARPLGIRDGVDYCHTGEVRRVDSSGINKLLDDGAIVLISPMGYSPTGEIFNLSAEDVAATAAIALKADKLIFLIEDTGLRDNQKNLIRELSLSDAERMLADRDHIPDVKSDYLSNAMHVCKKGIHRVHIIDRHIDGALLLELFTRDGIGTLVTGDLFEGMRSATIDDVGGILDIITPLEQEGILVRRSRELLEMEINRFSIVERDGLIIGCAALYPYPDEQVAELACLVVTDEYRSAGRGDRLLEYIERKATDMGIKKIFVLTTRTAHWFQERGFVNSTVEALPVQRQTMYNYQRKSKVYIKEL